MAGFSYRGKNIGDFGDIWYIPDADERGTYALPYEVSEQELNGRDGAYYYGNRVEPREFALKCYYENLTQKDKENIMRWFNRNTKGRLIFDERDWVYYDVIPNGRVEFEDYRAMTCNGERYQGRMVIHLKAYCPFGKLLPDAMVNSNVTLVGAAWADISFVGSSTTGADNETLILYSARMPSDTYSTNDTLFYIYNPGTEPTPLLIKLAGATTNAAAVNPTDDNKWGRITNLTNGTKCEIVGMKQGNTTQLNATLNIDAETGRVTIVKPVETSLAFEMHQYGYIWLAPSVKYTDGIVVYYSDDNDTIVNLDGEFDQEMVGQYVWLANAWHKITAFTDANTMTVADTLTTADPMTSERTQIVTMNEINFNGFDLTTLEMSYTPRMR